MAKKVWRWNESGLAYSSTGYNGDYSSAAITADGKINADFIKAGKITAVDIEGVNIKGSEFSTEAGNHRSVISVSKGEIKTIIDSKVTGSLYAAYGSNGDGSTNEKRGVSLAVEDSGTLWLAYRDGTYENGIKKYGSILYASGEEIKNGHTPWIANTATGFMNFGKNRYGNGLPSHPNNYGVEVENGLIKRWVTTNLVRESGVDGGDDHDIAIGWNGSRLIFWVDGTFVCSLPSGYTP